MKTRLLVTNATSKTLRVRYTELLRLREDVQRLTVSCQETAEPKQRAPSLIQQRGSQNGVVPGQHFFSDALMYGETES